MIGQFGKPHLGMLAAFLVAATLPVMAEDLAKGSGGNCPTAAGLNGLRPGPAECPDFLVLPKYGVLPLEPWAGFETGQRTAWSTASDAGGEDQGAGHNTSTRGGRLARWLQHVTWSWAPPLRYGDPFPVSAMLNRP
ncbi:MAG: hypothetical protein ABSH05_14125 [Bryobacteraceae bacterium]|jgi:hypothetical protein